jgi:RHS repeat-associated protein
LERLEQRLAPGSILFALAGLLGEEATADTVTDSLPNPSDLSVAPERYPTTGEDGTLDLYVAAAPAPSDPSAGDEQGFDRSGQATDDESSLPDSAPATHFVSFQDNALDEALFTAIPDVFAGQQADASPGGGGGADLAADQGARLPAEDISPGTAPASETSSAAADGPGQSGSADRSSLPGALNSGPSSSPAAPTGPLPSHTTTALPVTPAAPVGQPATRSTTVSRTTVSPTVPALPAPTVAHPSALTVPPPATPPAPASPFAVPVLQTAIAFGAPGQGRLYVQGRLADTAAVGTQVHLDFFAAGASQASPAGPGTLLGSKTVTQTTAGSVSFTVVLAADVTPGEWIAATAHGQAGGPDWRTAVAVPANPPLSPSGLPVALEAMAPHQADGNSAGVAAGLRSDTVSVPAMTNGAFVTLQAPGLTFSEVQVYDAPADRASQLPLGLFGFQVHGVPPGGAATVKMILPDDVNVSAYFKQDPATGKLLPFNYNGVTGAEISGHSLTLHLVDGGPGDSDGKVDGTITDPGGPGSGNPTVPVSLALPASSSGDASAAPANPPVTGISSVVLTPLSVAEGSSFSTAVASFLDGSLNVTPADCTGIINWGDGTSQTLGSVVQEGQSGLALNGGHTYAEEGTYTVSVTLSDRFGSSVTQTEILVVSDAALSPAGPQAGGSTPQLTAYTNNSFHGVVGAFTDANPTVTQSEESATIDWGDGTTTSGIIGIAPTGEFQVSGSHTYAKAGTYLVKTLVLDVGGNQVNLYAQANVADPAIWGNLPQISVKEGSNFSGVVAVFTDSDGNTDPSAFTGTIQWGDGTTDNATVTASLQGPDTPLAGNATGPLGSGGQTVFLVAGSHTYAKAGTQAVTVKITDTDGATGTLIGAATVADADLTPKGGGAVTVTAGQLATVQLATFTDADPGASTGNFTATIDWGDKKTSAGTIKSTSTGFAVSGSHTYASSGNYAVAVTIVDSGGSQTTARTTVHAKPQIIANAGSQHTLTEVAVAISATEYTPFSGLVATFTSSPTGPASEFSATIAWGDGTSSAGTIAANNSGGFNVTGTHTFGDEATYWATVTVTDTTYGDQATATGQATAADAALTVTTTQINSAVEGEVFAALLATFSDPASDQGASYSATINWGDGQSSAATRVGLRIFGNHTYAEEGTYSMTVKVTDDGGGSGTASGTITVTDAPIAVTGTPITATEGTAFSGAVATVYNAIGESTATYTASIAWGDGTTSNGTVSNNQVTGSHTYAGSGAYAVTTTVTEDGSASAQATASAWVLDAPLTAANAPFTPIEGTPFNGTLATFSDSAANSGATYTASINWGDGSTTLGTVTSTNVSGSHVYAAADSYTIAVTVQDSGTASATTSQTITVADATPTGMSTTLAATQGQTFNGPVAWFQDSSPVATTANFTASITWPDGHTSTGAVANLGVGFEVLASAVLGSLGVGTVKVQISDVAGASTTVSSTVNVAATPFTLQAQPFTADLANPYSGTVAAFTDSNPNDTAANFTATVTWDDGGQTAGTITAASGGQFLISAAHTFATVGAYNLTVQLTRTASNQTVTSATLVDVVVGNLSVVDPEFVGTEGLPSTGIVTNFTIDNPHAVASDFTATIYWGDDTASLAGSITSVGSNTFAVSGTHAYQEEGGFIITVVVKDLTGASLQVTNGALVIGAPITARGTTLSPLEGQSFNSIVATFSDADAGANSGDFSAVIDWGDGHIWPFGSITPDKAGGFDVWGNHVYFEEGLYQITVYIRDEGTSKVQAASIATVSDVPLVAGGWGNGYVGATANIPWTGIVASFNEGIFDPGTDFSAQIDWGDGSQSPGQILAPDGQGWGIPGFFGYYFGYPGYFIVAGSHTYGHGGIFTVKVTINEADGDHSTAQSTMWVQPLYWTIAGPDPYLTVTAQSISLNEGQTFSGAIGTLTDSLANDNGPPSQVLINWGDGIGVSWFASHGFGYEWTLGTATPNGNGTYTLSGTHTYAEDGTYTITVLVIDTDDGYYFSGSGYAQATSSASVAEAVITNITLQPSSSSVSVAEGQSTGTVTVASFTSGNTSASTSEFPAIIDWGDGSPTVPGTVSGTSGNFIVTGSHTYTDAGSYDISVLIEDTPAGSTDAQGNPIPVQSVSAYTTATVAEQPLTAAGLKNTLQVNQNQSFSNQVVATFHDADTAEPLTSYGITIWWGDSQSSAGQVTLASDGVTRQVVGSHKYTLAGVFTVRVFIDEDPATFLNFSSTPAYGYNWGSGGYYWGNGIHYSSGPLWIGIPTSTVQVIPPSSSMVPNFSVVSVTPLTVVEGISLKNIILGEFADQVNLNPLSADYATIDWGDGSQSASTLVLDTGNKYQVEGSHTYAEEGDYLIAVTFGSTSCSCCQATGYTSAVVSDQPLAASPVNLPVTAAWHDNFFGYGTSLRWDMLGNFLGYGPPLGWDAADWGFGFGASRWLPNGSQSGLNDAVVATFTDPHGGQPTYSYWSVIAWGDGQFSAGTIVQSGGQYLVLGSHQYIFQGTFTVTVNILDGSDQAVQVQEIAQVVAAAVGVAAKINVANFHNANLYEAQLEGDITWGDGTPTTVEYSGWGYSPIWPWGNGGFPNGWYWPYGLGWYSSTTPVAEWHLFANEGTYSIQTSLLDDGSATKATTTVQVADATLSIVGTVPQLTADVNSFMGNPFLVDFSDADLSGKASQYSATISWGDGTAASAGTIVANADGTFCVQGDHAYSQFGSFMVVITIQDHAHSNSTSQTTTWTRITVANPTLAVQAQKFGAVVGAPTGPVTVATATGVLANEGVKASIYWGDGVASVGTVTVNTNTGTATISGNHTYTWQGTFPVTVTLTDASGTLVRVTGQATVWPWSLASGQLTNDPRQAELLPVAQAKVALATGGVRISQALDFDQSPGASVSGDPALVYNSDTVNVQPVLQLEFATGPYDPVPTSITASVSWNGGPWQAPVTYNYNAPGTSYKPGNTYLLAIQDADPIAISGVYNWQVQVTFTFSDGKTRPISAVYSGQAPVVAQDNSPYGAGWNIDGLVSLVPCTDGGVLWVYGNGDSDFFAENSSGGYTSPSGNFGTLVQNNDGTFTYTAVDQVKWNFSSVGELTSVVDTHGLTRSYTYSSGLLTQIVAPDGGVTTFAYRGVSLASITEPGNRAVSVNISTGTIGNPGSGGNLIAITDADGNTRTLNYSSVGHLLVEDKWGPLDTLFGYTSGGLLDSLTPGSSSALTISPEALQGLAGFVPATAGDATVTDALFLTDTYWLDAAGRPLEHEQPDGTAEAWQRNSDGQVTLATNFDGGTTQYTYDETTAGHGDLLQVVYADGGTETYTYEHTFHHVTSDTDPDGHVTSWVYDTKTADLLSTTDPAGATTTNVWSAGLLQTSTGPKGTTTYYYDANRRLDETKDPDGFITTVSYDNNGNPATTVDPDHGTTSTSYDNRNELLSTTTPANNTTTTSYDAAGDISTTVDANGIKTTNTYDVRGLLITSAFGGLVTQYAYNAAEERSSTTDPNGNTTKQTYDQDRRPSVATDPDHYNASTSYDENGNVLETIDGAGNYTINSYDPRDRLLTSVTYDANSGLIAASTTNTLDKAGNLLKTVDGAGNYTVNTYDPDNRLLTTATYDASGLLVSSATNTYDGDGNLLKTVDGDGNYTANTYDADDRLLTTASYDANGTLVSSATNTYDGNGNLRQSVDGDGNYTVNTYDGDGHRLTTKGYDQNGTLVAQETTAYDPDGNVVKSTDGAGNYTVSTYTAQDRLATRKSYDQNGAQVSSTTDTYDNDGNLLTTTDGAGNVTSYSYDGDNNQTGSTTTSGAGGTAVSETDIPDGAGNIVQRTDGDLNYTKNAYDAEGQVLASQTFDANGTLVASTMNTYDGAGHLQKTVDGNGNYTLTSYDEAGKLLTSQTYDAGNALITGTVNTYDAAGNLLKTVDGAGNYTTATYDEAGHVLTRATYDANGTQVASLTNTYDDAGNVLKSVDGNGNTTTRTYDEAGNVLTSQTTNAGGGVAASATNTYDDAGNLLQTVDGVGNYTVNTYDEAGHVLTSQTFNANNVLTASTTNTYDEAGNLSITVDGAGDTTTNVYNAFGQLLSTQTAGSGGTAAAEQDVYDAADHLTKTVDGNNNYTVTTDDANGQVLTSQTFNASGGLVASATNTYDLDGNLLKSVDGNNNYTVKSYDGADREISRATYDANGTLVSSTTDVLDGDGHVLQATDGDGNYTVDTYDAEGQVLTSQTYNAGGSLVASVTNTYDETGNLLKTVDGVGDTTVSTYDANNHLVTSQTSGAGGTVASTTNTYDAAGNLLKSVDGVGNYTVDTYNATGQVLTSQTFGAGGVLASSTVNTYDGASHLLKTVDGDGNYTLNTYDADGRLLTRKTFNGATNAQVSSTTNSYDEDGNLVSTTDGAGDSTTNTYDATGHVLTSQTTGSGGTIASITNTYDLAGNVLKSVDGVGDITTDTYDADGNLLSSQTSGPGGVADSSTDTYDQADHPLKRVDGDGNYTIDTYNANGQVLTSQTINAVGGTVAASTTNTYDLAGNLTKTVDGDNNYTINTYNAAGQVLTSKTYSAGNSLTSSTTNTYDAAGQLLKTVDGDNTTTVNTYDGAGRLLTSATADGAGFPVTSTTNSFDVAGNLLKTTDGVGNYTLNTYDADGNVLTSQSYTVGGVLAASTSNSYDQADHLVQSVDGDGNTTVNGYTADGQLLSSVTTDVTNHLVSSTSNTFDAAGHLLKTVDGNGSTTVYAFNAAGQQTSVTLGYGTAAAATTLTTYDPAGFISTIKDPDGNVTSYTHDAEGHTLTTTDALSHTDTRVYDPAGNLITETNRNGLKRVLTYDANGNVLTEVWYTAGGTVADQRVYSYDQAGNLLTAGNSAGTYTMTYDGNRLATQTDPNGIKLVFGYDQDQRVTSVADNLGGTVNSVYDGAGNLTQRTFSGPNSQQLRLDMTYDTAANLLTVTRSSDLAGHNKVGSSQYRYDGNRLMQITHLDGAGNTLANYQYSYDAGLRLTSENDNGTTTGYGYDSTNQLISAGSATYTYDSNGNRTLTGYHTGTNNELTSDGTWNYQYDLEGNIIGKTNPTTGEVWTYTYDNLNHLTSALDKDSHGNILTSALYTYDVFGRELGSAVTQSGTTTTTGFSYDQNGNLWADLTSTHGLQMRYVRGDQPNQLLARVDGSGNTSWYLTDHLGSVRGITNAAGALQLSITYDAFGNTATSGFGRFGYAGMQFDAETTLYRTANRLYSPATGRWYSQDPEGLTPDSDPYRYVGNNAVNATDPTGLEADQPGFLQSTLGVAGAAFRLSAEERRAFLKLWQNPTERYARDYIQTHSADSGYDPDAVASYIRDMLRLTPDERRRAGAEVAGFQQPPPPDRRQADLDQWVQEAADLQRQRLADAAAVESAINNDLARRRAFAAPLRASANQLMDQRQNSLAWVFFGGSVYGPMTNSERTLREQADNAFDTSKFEVQDGKLVPISPEGAALQQRWTRMQEIDAMGAVDRLKLALEKGVERLPGKVKEAFQSELKTLLSQETLTQLSLGLGLWAVGHAFGVSQVVDGVLGVIGLVMFGTKAIDITKDLYFFLDNALNAKSDADFEAAGEHFANGITQVAVDSGKIAAAALLGLGLRGLRKGARKHGTGDYQDFQRQQAGNPELQGLTPSARNAKLKEMFQAEQRARQAAEEARRAAQAPKRARKTRLEDAETVRGLGGEVYRVLRDPKGREVKIYGHERSSSKTPGHPEAIIHQAERMVESGEYKEIYLQRAWNTATGEAGASELRPDVIGVRWNGKVDAWEVWSKTDISRNIDLKGRLQEGRKSLPKGRRGSLEVLDPEP